MNVQRRKSRPVRVGNITIGGDNPIVVQSMTNTSTNDTRQSALQAGTIADAGGQLVRLTTQGTTEAANLKNIREEMNGLGCDVAISADVHFNPKAAFEAAKYADKVRINPGNFDIRQFPEFLNICRRRDIAVRIGVNHGSLSERMMHKYGDTPLGMVESALEYLRIARENDFHDIIISIKSSNTAVMVETVRLLVRMLEEEGMDYPLHLGVTEAGDAEDGRIKSAVGIGALLHDGIGDTIRVSLSEPPENEIPVARLLVDHVTEQMKTGKLHRLATKLKEEKDERDRKDGKDNKGATTPQVIELEYDCDDLDELRVRAGADFGYLLLSGLGDDIKVVDRHYDRTTLDRLAADIMQAARRRFYKTEFIACPSCGRTLFDLQTELKRVKEAVSKLGNPGLKIAVMGCIVNGPGEMADADYGYVGAGPGRVSVYRGKQLIHKNIPADQALDLLLNLITQDQQK